MANGTQQQQQQQQQQQEPEQKAPPAPPAPRENASMEKRVAAAVEKLYGKGFDILAHTVRDNVATVVISRKIAPFTSGKVRIDLDEPLVDERMYERLNPAKKG